MTKVYVLYWVPGSCGDFLQHLVGMHPDWYTGHRFDLDANGRFRRSIDQDFLTMFPCDSNQWLFRDWSVMDLKNLFAVSTNTVMVGTHSLDQLRKIKKYLKDDVTTIGVIYDTNLYPAVIKNFCMKVADTDPAINQIYSQHMIQLYQKLKQHNVFGAKVLKDCLIHKNVVPLQQINEFDIAIDLEHVLLGNFQWFNHWITDQMSTHISTWLSRQDPLYSIAVQANADYVRCLGVNTKAQQAESNAIELDIYHQILIQHCYPKAPKFATHLDFKKFTENLNKY